MTELLDRDVVAESLRTTTARLNRRLRAEAGQSDFTAAQASVIRRLVEGGPATTSELARAEDVRPQSMSATLASLEAMGLVGRRRDPDDGRAVRLFVTDEGMREILEGRAAKQGWLVRAMHGLTDAEIRTLSEASALIDRLLRADAPRS